YSAPAVELATAAGVDAAGAALAAVAPCSGTTALLEAGAAEPLRASFCCCLCHQSSALAAYQRLPLRTISTVLCMGWSNTVQVISTVASSACWSSTLTLAESSVSSNDRP